MKGRIAEIDLRLKAATPGPWRTVRNNAMGETWFNIFERGGDNVLAMISDLDDKCRYCPDADFIAHAPSDIEFLLKENERLRTALERVQAHGLAHYDDCPNHSYDDENCVCGMEATELIVRQALEGGET